MVPEKEREGHMSKQQKKARFAYYGGRHRFEVRHPGHPAPLAVIAPDEASAIVAAAEKWGEQWTKAEFYGFCTVAEVTEHAREQGRKQGLHGGHEGDAYRLF